MEAELIVLVATAMEVVMMLLVEVVGMLLVVEAIESCPIVELKNEGDGEEDEGTNGLCWTLWGEGRNG